LLNDKIVAGKPLEIVGGHAFWLQHLLDERLDRDGLAVATERTEHFTRRRRRRFISGINAEAFGLFREHQAKINLLIQSFSLRLGLRSGHSLF